MYKNEEHKCKNTQERTLLVGSILLRHVLDQVDDAAAVAKLVVVPADELDKRVVQRDAGLGVEDAGVGVADKVGRHNLVLSVAENALDRKEKGCC